MSRYLRQTVLPQIGTDGQERIATAHVLVVGAGGLGVPVLLCLLRLRERPFSGRNAVGSLLYPAW